MCEFLFTEHAMERRCEVEKKTPESISLTGSDSIVQSGPIKTSSRTRLESAGGTAEEVNGTLSTAQRNQKSPNTSTYAGKES